MTIAPIPRGPVYAPAFVLPVLSESRKIAIHATPINPSRVQIIFRVVLMSKFGFWRFTFESEHSRIRFMENFKHFVLFDRRKIERFLKKKKSLRFIAGKFGRSVSSVSDEISRNSVKGTYDAEKADHKAYAKRKYSKKDCLKVALD